MAANQAAVNVAIANPIFSNTGYINSKTHGYYNPEANLSYFQNLNPGNFNYRGNPPSNNTTSNPASNNKNSQLHRRERFIHTTSPCRNKDLKNTFEHDTERRNQEAKLLELQAMNMEKEKVKKSDAEWKAELNAEEYNVLRKKGTERAGTGEYDKHYPKTGYYVCKGCKLPLYSYKAKFNSGCGWPAYNQCYHSNEWGCHVKWEEDNSFGMVRTEILCKRCDGHLGHVFYGEKGPDTERHCVNSVSVKYVDGAEPEGLKAGPVKANIASL